MEAATNQLKLNLIVMSIALPDGLNVDYANVVILHSYCEGLFGIVERHA